MTFVRAESFLLVNIPHAQSFKIKIVNHYVNNFQENLLIKEHIFKTNFEFSNRDAATSPSN